MAEKEVTTSKRLVYNTVSNVVALAGNAVIGFVLIRFFLVHLGEARYGVWLLLGGAVFKYGALLTIGLSSSINRYVPVYLAKGDYEGIARVTSTSVFFFLAAAAVLVAVALTVRAHVDDWFAIEAELIPAARLLVVVVGFSFAAAMPFQVATGVLSGLQRYDAINYGLIGMLLVRTAILVVLLVRGYGLLTTGLVFGLGEVAMRVVHTLWARRLLRQFSFSLRKVDGGLLKEMLTYGVNTFLYTMGAVIMYHASTVVIGVLIGPAQISQFTVASAGIFLLCQFVQAFTAAIKPAVSDLDARDDQSRVREISFLTQKYSLLLIIPAGCFLIAMGKEFLQVWVGEKFPQPAAISTLGVVLAILTVGHCLRLSQHSNFLVLVGRGQHRIFGVMTAATALLCVVGSVVAVRVLGLGLVGIAWANCLPMVLISGLILPIYFNVKMRVSLWDSLRRVWWPSLLGCAPAVAVIATWDLLRPPASWWELFAVVVVVALVTVAAGWFLSMKELERRRLLAVVGVRRN